MQSMSDPTPSFPIATLTVQPWPDPVIDAVGHEVRSPYVERFWLGLLGPSSTWLLRRLVAGLDEAPDGYELDLALTATELGLGARSGRHSPFLRSIDRCCRFGAAHQIDETHPAGAAQAAAAHTRSRWPASRPRCSRPTRRGPTRPRPGLPVRRAARASPRAGALPPRAGRGHRGHRAPAPRLAPAPRHRPRRGRLGGRAPRASPKQIPPDDLPPEAA